MNCLAQASSPVAVGSQGKSALSLATAAVAIDVAAVMYASASRPVTTSSSALLVNPRLASSGGKVLTTSVLTPKRSEMVAWYS
jgi:hypothetical protein